MIVGDDTLFPNNIVNLIATRAAMLDSDLTIVKRPLRSSDPNQSVGITAANWLPEERTKEMLGPGAPNQPPISKYLITVQGFIRDMEEERGLNVHSVLSMWLRSMLYNDVPLRVGLSALSSTLNGMTEASRRWGVSQQRFVSNEIGGEWLYLSILEFWLETETM